MTPLADAYTDLRGKTKVMTTQMGASRDVSKSTKGWSVGIGLNVGKQFTDSVSLEFDPYYRHKTICKSREIVLDGDRTKMGRSKSNEYDFRIAAMF
ncbi:MULTISPECIES: hypothetical protein [Neisseria]|uniref:hypothetical protein n=1 Tax=Neisseria TaxID=482 RepID=UPI000E59E060|nr:hypothetical protein [Neisseria sp. Marseille-Q1983]